MSKQIVVSAIMLAVIASTTAALHSGTFPAIALPTQAQAERAIREVAGLPPKPVAVGADSDALLFSGKGGCKSQTQAIGPCSVNYQVCYGIDKFHWKYKATACVGSVCGSSGRDDSATGSAYDATFALFQQRPSCACGASNVPLGNCTFGVSGCFEFASSAAVQAKQVSFFANVSDVQTGVWADFCCASNATDALKSAFVSLSQKESLARCY